MEGQVIKKIGDIVNDFELDFDNPVIQEHVDHLRYMPIIDGISESDRYHQPESQTKTEKECQSKMDH